MNKNTVRNQVNGLLIFHIFPPVFNVATLRFISIVKFLHLNKIRINVLTTKPRTNDYVDLSRRDEIPKDVFVRRVFALDPKRDLSVRGKHFAFTAYPDHLVAWIIPAVIAGYKMIKNHHAQFVLCSYPFSSTCITGVILSTIFKIPLITDFRDPMVQIGYPSDRIKRKLWKILEKLIIKKSHQIIFNTSKMKDYYLERYEFLDASDCYVIRNGFSEEDFSEIKNKPDTKTEQKKTTYIHAGTIYEGERDPRTLIKGIALLCEGKISAQGLRDFQIHFYGSGNDELINEYRELVNDYGLSDIISFFPRVTHKKMIEIMLASDVLLLIGGAKNWDMQIPAKFYEYLRIRKPILSISSERSELAELIKALNAGYVAPYESPGLIKNVFSELNFKISNNHALNVISENNIKSFSRDVQLKKLDKIIINCLRQ